MLHHLLQLEKNRETQLLYKPHFYFDTLQYRISLCSWTLARLNDMPGYRLSTYLSLPFWSIWAGFQYSFCMARMICCIHHIFRTPWITRIAKGSIPGRMVEL